VSWLLFGKEATMQSVLFQGFCRVVIQQRKWNGGFTVAAFSLAAGKCMEGLCERINLRPFKEVSTLKL